jgi:hypothetical protein
VFDLHSGDRDGCNPIHCHGSDVADGLGAARHKRSSQLPEEGCTVQKELTLQEFYASDPRRAHSREVAYGGLWREFAPVPAYRLAWVQATGEVYAVELSERDERKDPVEVLGVLWSRPQVEACLAGWSERCGGQRSLLWARDRVRRWRPVVEETQFTQAPEPAR